MKFKAVFFDLDETLYPMGNPIVATIGERMNEYIQTRLNVPADEVSKFRESLFKEYGTTAKGLVLEYQFDLNDFLKYVHVTNVEDFIQPAPLLSDVLSKIPCHKYVFTNGDRFHAFRILKQLGILTYFDGIIDVLDVFPECKPDQKAFELALRLTGQDNPSQCVFIDDHVGNVETAHRLGFCTVHVTGDLRPHCAFADYSIRKIEDLPQLDLFSC